MQPSIKAKGEGVEPDYGAMTVWELAAWHDLNRRSLHFITCQKIQAEIMKRPYNEQVLASRLNYYLPVEASKELFNNK